MSDIDDAINALRNLTKCTCHEAYSGRGMEDPNCLHHEYAEYVEALAARVVALETALNGVLSAVDIPQSGPTVCMSSEDAIRSACNGLDLQLAVIGAKAILEERDEVRR
jgi:hypothetical protein